MRKILDLTGKRFGRLLVLSRDIDLGAETGWLCRCDCGKTIICRRTNLRSGKSRSCRCSIVRANKMRATHGLSGTPTYRAWKSMKWRCYNYKCAEYLHYGGRGIKVCDRWIHSYENFFADMGERPSDKYSLERVDNNGDYCPENCKWATKKEQCRNRRGLHYLTIDGQTKCLSEWCQIYGLNPGTVFHRMKKRGWDVVKAVTTKAWAVRVLKPKNPTQ
jgi:hypothetical protein